MTKVKGLQEFFRKMDAVAAAYDKLPNELAAIAVKFSKDRFRAQAWLDRTEQKWKPLARRRRGKKRSQTVLVITGRLKRSIRKVRADSHLIIIGTDAPQAQILNDGGTIKKTVSVKQHTVHSYKRKAHKRTIKGRTRRIKSTIIKTHSVAAHQRMMNVTIPARPFIGPSHTLESQLLNHAKDRFDEALKK